MRVDDAGRAGHEIETPRLGLFDGYESYLSISDADVQQVIEGGIVAFDTNVLLNLYRYSTEARTAFFQVVDRIGPSLFIPNQSVEEFWRNRDSVMSDPREAEALFTALESSRTSAVQAVSTWANQAHRASVDIASLRGIIDDSMSEVQAAIQAFEAEHGFPSNLDTQDDVVLRSLHEAVEGAVGPKPSPEEMSVHLKEAHRRISQSLPPGYKDQGKARFAHGDYFVWRQILDEASRRSASVLFVTADSKEDWWRIHEGRRRGPRTELAQELQSVAGVGARLVMLLPSEFLAVAGRVLEVQISQQTLTAAQSLEAASVQLVEDRFELSCPVCGYGMAIAVPASLGDARSIACLQCASKLILYPEELVVEFDGELRLHHCDFNELAEAGVRQEKSRPVLSCPDCERLFVAVLNDHGRFMIACFQDDVLMYVRHEEFEEHRGT